MTLQETVQNYERFGKCERFEWKCSKWFFHNYNGKLLNAKVQILIEKLLKGIVHQKCYFCQHLITLMFVEHKRRYFEKCFCFFCQYCTIEVKSNKTVGFQLNSKSYKFTVT